MLLAKSWGATAPPPQELPPVKICQLEEIACEFGPLGCDIRFNQEEHTRQSNQKHLALIASLAMKTKEQLLHQQEKRLEEKHVGTSSA